MDLITIVEWCNKNGVSTENAKDMGGHATKVCKANRVEMSFIPVCNLPYDKVNTYPELVLDNLFKDLVPKLKPQDIETRVGFSLEEEPVDDNIVDKRHKHCDLIIAWANGAEIQFFNDDEWVNCTNPSWDEDVHYRVEPKLVKREGWVCICIGPGDLSSHRVRRVDQDIYSTIEEAEEAGQEAADIGPAWRGATARIEWLEEEE